MPKRIKRRRKSQVGPLGCFNCGHERRGEVCCPKCGHMHRDYSDLQGSDTGRGRLWSAGDRGTDNEDTD
jgi:hypothetical protein